MVFTLGRLLRRFNTINYLITEDLVEGNSIITSEMEKALGRFTEEFAELIKDTELKGVWNSVD